MGTDVWDVPMPEQHASRVLDNFQENSYLFFNEHHRYWREKGKLGTDWQHPLKWISLPVRANYVVSAGPKNTFLNGYGCYSSDFELIQ